MSSTIQETFMSDTFSSDPFKPMLKRLSNLGILISTSASSISLDNTDSDKKIAVSYLNYTHGGKSGSFSIFGPYYFQNSNFTAKLTYNVDRKLAVITCYDYENTNHSVYVRLPLIVSSTDFWTLGFQKDFSLSEISSSWTWATALGHNSTDARPSADGKVSLLGNPKLGIPSTASWGAYVKQLQGDGVYVSKEDIVDPVSDIGRIISDSSGKNYICCGCRIWMDYDSE